jgi:formylglycine-generating enzyme required for sulfatase activity
MKLKEGYLQLEGYRLPSEAEWEYACRAEAVTSRPYGEGEQLLGQYAWYAQNSLGRGMAPAGSLKPNDLGLFDMLGNALEWCQERSAFYPSAEGDRAVEDREGQLDIHDPQVRVLRGGSFQFQAGYERAAFRSKDRPSVGPNYVGFRPARTIHTAP